MEDVKGRTYAAIVEAEKTPRSELPKFRYLIISSDGKLTVSESFQNYYFDALNKKCLVIDLRLKNYFNSFNKQWVTLPHEKLDEYFSLDLRMGL